MATKKTNTLAELRTKFNQIRLDIWARQEKNTNAHKNIKRQIAQELSKSK